MSSSGSSSNAPASPSGSLKSHCTAAALERRIAALERMVAAIERRIAALERMVAAIGRRIAAIERRIASRRKKPSALCWNNFTASKPRRRGKLK